MNNFHTPVLLKEVLEILDIKKDSWYLDCNLGGGSHTQAILETGGNVIAIDLDQEALDEVSTRLKDYITSGKLILVKDNFKNLDEVVKKHQKEIIGILFDLGTSSHQIQKGDRGFSFLRDAPLDMRMDQTTSSATAADLINGLHEGELVELFQRLGEETFSKRIAKKIVEYRKQKPIQTTHELAELIKSALPRSKDKIHPATKVFQALRIAVNDELNSLKETLPKAFEVLSPGGKLIVISFHSLEDRIVKTFFNSLSHSGVESTMIESSHQANILTDKPVEPTLDEIYDNPRSRSSKLRALEKIA